MQPTTTQQQPVVQQQQQQQEVPAEYAPIKQIFEDLISACLQAQHATPVSSVLNIDILQYVVFINNIYTFYSCYVNVWKKLNIKYNSNYTHV